MIVQNEKKAENDRSLRADAAELAVLGALVLVPELMARVRILLTMADFFVPAYAVLFEAMCVVFDRHGGNIDLPLLRAQLMSSKKDSIVEDMVRLDELEFHGQDHERIEEHARAVHDASQLRKLDQFGHLLGLRVRQESARPIAELTWAHEQLAELEKNTGQSRTEGICEVLDVVQKEMTDRIEGNPEVQHEFVTHGIEGADEMFDPIQTSEFAIIAAPPGSGKTTALTQMAAMNAMLQKGVLVVSGEMLNKEIAAKILSFTAEIDSRVIGRTVPSREQYESAMERADFLRSKLKDSIQFMRGRFHHSEIRHEVLKLNARPDKPKIKLVLVDYLQLCKYKNDEMQREEGVSENAQGLRELALDYDVAVVAASAFNREVSKVTPGKKQPRPQLSNLRESGLIEYAATRIYFLHRDVEDPTRPPEPEEPVIMIGAKNRGGPRMELNLKMILKFCRFDLAS